MEINELHFFHGFLGGPQDWQGVLDHLPIPPGTEVFCHDLLADFKDLGSQKGFIQWANAKQSSWDSRRKRVLVGYSLGGRLAMHLSPSSFEKLFLIGSHPGLKEAIEERKKSDQAWFRKLASSTAQEWLEAWNQQEVFKNDRTRPQRDYNKEQLEAQVDMLLSWSLAKQQDQRGPLLENFRKYHWACGAEDPKFINMFEEMRGLLPRKNVTTIADSGHGCLFDNPQAVAQWIEKGLADA